MRSETTLRVEKKSDVNISRWPVGSRNVWGLRDHQVTFDEIDLGEEEDQVWRAL